MWDKQLPGKSYNERLFSGSRFRSFLHNARFKWFKETVARYYTEPFSLLELGCFDGRLIEFCPNPPLKYQGFDADWEGGLTAAQERYSGHPYWVFSKAIQPQDMASLETASFSLAASMETLEHVPPEAIDGYLQQIARATDGLFLVTVPNEKGPVFLLKYLLKHLLTRSGESYSTKEVFYATLGRLEHVNRNEHKGFDHAALAREIDQYFEICEIAPLPFKWLPLWASFTIAITARSKKKIDG